VFQETFEPVYNVIQVTVMWSDIAHFEGESISDQTVWGLQLLSEVNPADIQRCLSAMYAAIEGRDPEIFARLARELDAYISDAVGELARLDVNHPSVEHARREVERTRLMAVAGDLRAKAEEAVQNAERAALRASEAAESSEAAAGVSGSAALGQHFLDRANEEEAAATRWRKTVLGVIGLAVAAGIYIFIEDVQGVPISWVARASITLPLFVLAAYAAREATQHRDAARRARWLADQLRTFEAFSGPLPEGQRAALRANFGNRIFSHGAMEGGSDGVEADSAETMKTLLDKILELLRTARVGG
jgi:hypothetical protein